VSVGVILCDGFCMGVCGASPMFGSLASGCGSCVRSTGACFRSSRGCFRSSGLLVSDILVRLRENLGEKSRWRNGLVPPGVGVLLLRMLVGSGLLQAVFSASLLDISR
jgi:hypothetical protein